MSSTLSDDSQLTQKKRSHMRERTPKRTSRKEENISKHKNNDRYIDKRSKKHSSKSRSTRREKSLKQSKKNNHNHKISTSSSSSESRSNSKSSSSSNESEESTPHKHKKSVKKYKKKEKNGKKEKTEDELKRRQERRKRKYDDEVDDLKTKELEKRREVEQKRLQEIHKKEKEEKRRQEMINKKKEVVLTEEEKELYKKKSRLARARLFSRLEREQEKKNEENYLENEEFLEELVKGDKFNEDDNLEKDEIEEDKEVNSNNKHENIKKDIESNIITEDIRINEMKNKDANYDDFNFTFDKKKLPKLPKEFIDEKSNKVDSFNNHKQAYNKYQEIKKIEEEDPLDAYMKGIEKDATMQEYEIIQKFYNQQLQQRYDEIAEKDGYDIDDSGRNDEVQLNEKIIFNHKETPGSVDKSKIITLEEILNQMKEKKNIEEKQSEDTIKINNEEDFHKEFINTIKEKTFTEVEMKAEYEERKEDILYGEDVNEFLKEEIFEEPEDFLTKAKKMSEKKELKLVNHENVKYDPFRKNLYVQVKEISNLTQEEVDLYRKLNGDIKVRGKNVPKPITNWYQCGLPDRALMVLEKKKFKNPFPIQSQGIPCIMSGRDVIGIAETGSGKTLAYVLPMIRHVLDQAPLKDGEGPIALVMVPTRELAFQIYIETKSFCKLMDLSCVCVYGGAGVGNQLSDLRRGAEIVICTPGRMIDVLCLSNGKITNLRRVTYVVIDEADRLFDMGFEPQIARILANIRPDRQTVLFSATFPKQIESLAKKILIKPIEIVVGTRGQSCVNVEQCVEVRDESTKFYRLLEILGEYSSKNTSILIFVDKQVEADELFKELFKLGYYCLVIHGGQDQEDRDYAISDFKSGVRNILIATSVCARGLDVKHCGLVINFKCPNHMEDYVHRVGRTGRAGNKGFAYTFISPEEGHQAEDILRSLELSNQKLPEELRNLVRSYKEKLDNGEVDKYRTNGFYGRGFKFNDNEKDKIKQIRKELGKTYGVNNNESDSEDEPEIKGGDPNSAENGPEKTNAITKVKDDEKKKKLLGLFKDPKAKQLAMDAGMMAAKNSIIAGKSEEQALMIAQEAIEKVIQEYRPSVSTEKGVEQASKIIEDWVDKENEKNNIFTAELEINDYPTAARSRVCGREFISSIYEMTGCNVCVRGNYVESGKKVPSGMKKLHLYIQGSTKIEVSSAYKEIKRILDENALQYYTMGNNNGYTGNSGRYQI